MKLIDKDALVAEIEKRIKELQDLFKEDEKKLDSFQKTAILLCIDECKGILSLIDTLEVKEVGLIIYTIIAECCDWLAMNTNLSHNEIEGCRNLMLTVKDEQLKAQKGK